MNGLSPAFTVCEFGQSSGLVTRLAQQPEKHIQAQKGNKKIVVLLMDAYVTPGILKYKDPL